MRAIGMIILCLLMTACAVMTPPPSQSLIPYLQSDHKLALNVRLIFIDVTKNQDNIDIAVGNLTIAQQYFEKINVTFNVTRIDQYSSCENVYDLSSIVNDSSCYEEYLNIYLCPPTNYLLGWSTFPEQGPLPAVLLFGYGWESDPSIYAHEIGHYLALRHTFDQNNKEGLYNGQGIYANDPNIMGYGSNVEWYNKYFTDLQLINMRETLLKYRYKQLLNYDKQLTTYSGVS